ncbi:MAG TPA: hypothetical protein VGL94_12535 [Ktedonobacteraceae bacterium]
MTEPITIPRIELDPGGIQNRLDNHAEILKDISKKYDEQEQQLTLIYTDIGHMKTDVGVLKGSVNALKTDVEDVKADVKSIKATQSDHGEQFKEHSERLIRIEARLETMATRDDVRKIEATQERQEQLMQAILSRLPPKQ